MEVVIRGIDCLLTMDDRRGGRLGRVENAAVGITGDEVVWVGPDGDAPRGAVEVDGSGTVGMPGLVDCHTHLVWAGSRADEFGQRLAGRSYSEILEAGGGILSTVSATRRATTSELVELAVERMERALSWGTTVFEVKSGYGLSPTHEARCLAAARDAAHRAGVTVRTTFLGAHTVPAEHRGHREAYVREVVAEQLPAVADVADFADVYIDRGAFTVDEGRAILEAAAAHGLGLRVHAEQVAYTGAAAMAASLGARSADHLERLDADGVRALAEAGTTAVLLPGAMLYLRDTSPPTQALRAAGVPMAVATDFNPGSSPVADLWSCATLACLTMGLTVDEALLGITRVAARCLGLERHGWVGRGSAADLVLVEPPPGEPAAPDSLIQFLGPHRARAVIAGGRVLRAP